MAGHRRTTTILVSAAVSMLLSVPAAVWASHQFSDVSDTHPFHAEISALAGAGIAGGFADGTFRPSNTVTRQAMAAFFERGVGRADLGAGGATGQGRDTLEVARATVEAGAAGAGNGFVRLQGNAYAHISGSTAAARCPCLVELIIDDGQSVVARGHFLQVPGTLGAEGFALDGGSIQALVAINADRVTTYRLVADVFDTDAVDITVTGQLSATYVPLSGDGDASFARTDTCPRDDGLEDNDSDASTTPLYVPALGTGRAQAISCPGDEDWYRTFRVLTAGETITLDVLFPHAEGDIDVCLLRAPATTVACATSKTDNETIVHTIPSGGGAAYLVQVFLAADAGAVAGNRYELSMQRRPASAAASPEDAAGPLPGPAGLAGTKAGAEN